MKLEPGALYAFAKALLTDDPEAAAALCSIVKGAPVSGKGFRRAQDLGLADCNRHTGYKLNHQQKQVAEAIVDIVDK